MFEMEYKKMMDGIVPSSELISDTLTKAKAARQGKKPARRVRGSIVLAAILLFGIISASAITLGNIKIVSLEGANVSEEYLSRSESMEIKATASPSYVQLCNLIHQAPANEYWTGTEDGKTWPMKLPRETISSMEEFTSRITSSASRIPVPMAIPQGYRLKLATLGFYLNKKTIEDGFSLISKEVQPEGIRVYKYRVPDSIKENIDGYTLEFENDSEQYLFVRCHFSQLDCEQQYYADDESTIEPVIMEGMIDGIYIHNRFDSKMRELILRAIYLPNVEKISWPSDDAEYATIGESPNIIFNTLNFSIISNALDKDQLIKIAESLR